MRIILIQSKNFRTYVKCDNLGSDKSISGKSALGTEQLNENFGIATSELKQTGTVTASECPVLEAKSRYICRWILLYSALA